MAEDYDGRYVKVSDLRPNLEVGSVSTLQPGTQAEVSVTGSSPDFILNFGIPAGQPGAQGGWSGTSLGTHSAGTARDLNTVQSPGLYFQADGATASTQGATYNYPTGANLGVLEVVSTGNTRLQRYTVTNATLEQRVWVRGFNQSSNIWSVWQELQRVQDTGWRDVTASITNVTVNACHIRRRGSIVHVRFREYLRRPDSSGNTFLPISVGWRRSGGSAYAVVPTGFSDNSTVNAALFVSSIDMPVTFTSSPPNYWCEFSYLTDDPWPSTLPGTPA